MALFLFVIIVSCSVKKPYTYGFAPYNAYTYIHSPSLLNDASNSKNNERYPLTQLYAKGKGKNTTSMTEKRKKRGKKIMPKIMERPKVLDELPNPDKWDETLSSTDDGKEEQSSIQKKEEEIARSKAAALIALQKKSVEVLTHVRSRVESLPSDDIVRSINGGMYIVFDDILGSELCSEIKTEGQAMYRANKLELDLTAGVTSGEYVVPIKGGQEQYADCPRSVEYVVSLTRHFAGMLNKSVKTGDELTEEMPTSTTMNSLGYKLDETASISSLRVFDRKARLSSLALLTGKENLDDSMLAPPDIEKTPFSYIVDGNSDEVDLRRITAVYFMTPYDWDTECGGGITFRDADGRDVSIEAKNDRLLLFNSEKSLHRVEKWIGRNGIEGSCSCIVTHFVRHRQ